MTNVVLDPGHGGHDSGATGNGYREKDLVLRIGRRTKEILDNDYSGANVILTRSSDTFISLNRRSQIARNHNSNIFVSIHMNAFNGSARGVETFSHNNSSASNALRRTINNNIVRDMNAIKSGVTNRGVKKANFAVLRGTYQSSLSVLTEVLFIDSSWDAGIFRSNTNQFVENAAKAHAQAIASIGSNISGSYKGSGGSSGGGSTGSSAPRYNGQTFAQAHGDWWQEEGTKIRAIQRLLQLNGELPRSGISRVFDQQTLDAVRSFQDKHNLSYNGANFYGVPGNQTTKKLAEEANTTDGLPGDMVRVTANSVNYRHRSSWQDSAISGSVSKGEVFTIVARMLMSNESDLYELKSGNFISVHPSYVEVVKH